ncbi:hypothetical protein PQR63_06860 [Herbaspirillum rhizosphaerae]|uniref:Uncharacterized protein n=1 Tax=Herbaspirillum rhizosphaerae TaxID=346179 RepID=A0ABW8Z6H0_9BURK
MEKLIVPVYLNQRLVFDLLAMLQSGISTVTAITKVESENSSDKQKIGASFGLSQALSTLLKIDLSGEKNKSQESNSERKLSEERVHTPASLFYQLRNILIKENILQILSPDAMPKSGDIVEMTATLKRNPIVETMDSLSEMMNMASLFADKPEHQRGQKKQEKNSENVIFKQIAAFSESLKTGNTIDLTASSSSINHATVVTLETAFLNDPLMSDLVDGEFRVLGKVIRSIATSDDSINLMRKTALSKMPSHVLEPLFAHLSSLGSEQGFDIPELSWQILGPAVQILPIAIFA